MLGMGYIKHLVLQVELQNIHLNIIRHLLHLYIIY